MSYLTSGFITLSKLIPLRPQNDKGFLSESKRPSAIKSTKDSCFYNLNHSKQEHLQEPDKAKKTPPLVLFINLLMKDGKKTHALRVLSMTLSLFKARISKIKLQKHFSSLKKRQEVYRYFYNQGGMPLQGDPMRISFSKKTIANYSIKASTLFVVFSKKTSRNKKKSSLLSNVTFSWYLIYRKTFPFIFNFEKLFDNFYTKKSFFCGKFLDLKQYPLVKKNVQQTTLHLFGAIEKNKSVLLKKKDYPCMSFGGRSGLSRFGVNKGQSALHALHDHTSDISCSKEHEPASKATVYMQSKHQALDYLAKTNNSEKKSSGQTIKQHAPFQNKEVSESKNCLWYKTLAKKPSWAKLTSAQKNTFLFCLYKAISNVKPPLECRTKRIGGSNKQIPSQVSDHRQWGIAIRWIIEVAQNEFSKKKNKINLYKGVNRSTLNNISKTSVNVTDKFKSPRGSALLKKNTVQIKQGQLGSWVLEEKTQFLSSFKQKKAKLGGLKVQSKKTRFYSFCFFLAESLENAYYKTGPAMQKRNLWVETALANRAFLRYRWW